jgi:hypothetical protein
MAKRQTLAEMVEEKYDDPEHQRAVLDDIAKNGTESLILAGKSVLPSAEDVAIWYDRITGKTAMTPTERSQAELLKAQEDRLARLETQLAQLQNNPKQEVQ